MILHTYRYEELEDDEISEGLENCRVQIRHHLKLMTNWEIEQERLEKEQKRREGK